MTYLNELDINSKKENSIIEWLYKKPFKDGYLDNCFTNEIVLYDTSLEHYDSIIEALIHGNHKPLEYKPSKLTNIIFKVCDKLNIGTDGYWFNVNCHDNEKGCIERIGKVQFDSKNGILNDIFILYDVLEQNPAKQGGTSYSGIVNNSKDWLLTIERGPNLTIRIHSSLKFCNEMKEQLLLAKPKLY